ELAVVQLEEDVHEGVAQSADVEFPGHAMLRGLLGGGLALVGRLDRGAALDEGDGGALHDDLAVVVEDLPAPGDLGAPAGRPGLDGEDSADDVDGVAGEDGVAEEPFADADDGLGAHGGRVQAEPAADGEDEQAVGDGPSEGGGAGEVVVDVDGVE